MLCKNSVTSEELGLPEYVQLQKKKKKKVGASRGQREAGSDLLYGGYEVSGDRVHT